MRTTDVRRLSLVALITLLLVAGCSSGGSSGGKTIKIAYQLFGGFTQFDVWIKGVKTDFEKANPGTTLKLIPIQASENDYYTKLDVMQGSTATSPDISYEDTFLINSDVKAGFLRPLDGYLNSWSDWSQFPDSAKSAAKGLDGKTYGVPMGTDTRALWYNKALLQQAGVPVPWEPKTWGDVLSAARAVKAKEPGVTPINVYSGKPAGEASTMQGFEMLLYGTPSGTLYDTNSKKWVAPSSGFESALGFVQTVYKEGLALTPQQALDPNIFTVIQQQMLPASKLAIDLDGSWLPGTWIANGPKPWPQWSDTLGVAPMPTEKGQPPGAVSMSGGWTLAIGQKSQNPDLAWKLITLALNKGNSVAYDIATSQIAVRNDVAADPKYLAGNPTQKVFTDLVKVTFYRPAYPVYPQVSNSVQVAMESVMTGQMSTSSAMNAYTQSVKQIVGQGSIQPAGTG
ncbi:MAG: extracellular solute-binding protein [Candidatus Dormibacteraeota bacterium]|nr:extracellular solute-binding protein [Candidatus Dormibacteraeota bacterium]